MSITAAQKTRLGIFMLAGLFLTLVFILIPLGVKLKNKQKPYYAYFSGESLSGLEQGATVKFKGIPIGKVDHIMYDPKNLNSVKVKFLIEEDFPMKEDMYAQTGMMGITGLKYVEILGGTNESKILPPGSVIQTKPSLMASLTGKSEVIIAKIELLLNNLNALLNPDSLLAVRRIINNTDSIINSLNDFVTSVKPDIKEITSSAKVTMKNVESVSYDVKKITNTFTQQVDYEGIASILAQIDSSAKSLKRLSSNMDLTIMQSKEDITASLENLRETLENVNELSQMLLENPSLLLRSEQQKERSIK